MVKQPNCECLKGIKNEDAKDTYSSHECSCMKPLVE
jgi:hypothetical protein